MLSLCLSRPGVAGREPPPQRPPLRLLETSAVSTQMHLIKFWGPGGRPWFTSTRVFTARAADYLKNPELQQATGTILCLPPGI